MYQFSSRVRYSESGEDGCLTLTGVINYLQDCTIFQSEDCGVGVRYLESKGRAWLLSSWRIFVYRYPEVGEQIQIGTWPYGNRGVYGYRNFMIEDSMGRRLAEADSSWFLLDLASGLPRRVAAEDLAAHGAPGEQIKMEPAPRKIQLPSSFEEGKAVTVGRHQIDTNHHVNNAQYVEIAREAAGCFEPVAELRADYKKAAYLGDVIYPRISRKADQVTVALQNSWEEAHAVIWMRTKTAAVDQADGGRREKDD